MKRNLAPQAMEQNFLVKLAGILIGLTLLLAVLLLAATRNVDTDTIFNASGLDFDVLKASAIAYINANTLVQKENAGEMARKVSYRDLP